MTEPNSPINPAILDHPIVEIKHYRISSESA